MRLDCFVNNMLLIGNIMYLVVYEHMKYDYYGYYKINTTYY